MQKSVIKGESQHHQKGQLLGIAGVQVLDEELRFGYFGVTSHGCDHRRSLSRADGYRFLKESLLFFGKIIGKENHREPDVNIRFDTTVR